MDNLLCLHHDHPAEAYLKPREPPPDIRQLSGRACLPLPACPGSHDGNPGSELGRVSLSAPAQLRILDTVLCLQQKAQKLVPNTDRAFRQRRPPLLPCANHRLVDGATTTYPASPRANLEADVSGKGRWVTCIFNTFAPRRRIVASPGCSGPRASS